jgi:hypothetical protein
MSNFPAISFAEATARLTAPGAPFEMETRDIRGVPLRVWKNAPPTLRDAFVAGRKFGGKTFLVYNDERASFEGFARASLAIAGALAEAASRSRCATCRNGPPRSSAPS